MAENLTLTSKAAKLVNVDVAHSVVVNGAAVCVAGRVGTYLSALGQVLEAGGSVGDSEALKVHDCIMGAIAPIPPRCECQQGRGRAGLLLGVALAFQGGSSFAEGTEVLTPEGKVAIETLREGDMVIAHNEETGISGIFPVTAVMSRQATDLMWLTLENEQGETTLLGVTSEHPLFSEGNGWLDASEIAAGDLIRDSKLQALTILAVEKDTRPQIVLKSSSNRPQPGDR